jgi:hypothetical protein
MVVWPWAGDSFGLREDDERLPSGQAIKREVSLIKSCYVPDPYVVGKAE